MVANTRLSLQSPPPFNLRHLVNPETAHAIALWLALLLALLLPFSVASCADDDDDNPPDTTVDDDDNDATANDDDLTSVDDDDNDATADDDDITGNDDDDDLTADDDDVTGDDDDNDATSDDDDTTTDDDDDDDDDDDQLGPPRQGYGEAIPLPEQLRGLPVQGYAPPPSNYLMRMWVSEPQAAPFATNAASVTLSGSILGVPASVTWQTSRGKSGSALFEQLNDAAASFIAIAIPREKGANTITCDAEGTLPTGRASTGSFTIEVTRAGGIVPEGPVVITNRAQPTCPNALDPCIGKTIDIRAPLRFGDVTVVKGSPRIEIVMNGEFAKACDLRDDGSLTTHHDEIAGDNIFSCKFPGLAIRSAKKLDLYVAWELEGGETERYLAGDLEYFTAPDVEAADAEQPHFDAVAGAYETIMQATPRPTREEAEAAQRVMIAGLIEDPAVNIIYFHPDDGTAFVYYASGVNRIVSGGMGGDELSVPTKPSAGARAVGRARALLVDALGDEQPSSGVTDLTVARGHISAATCPPIDAAPDLTDTKAILDALRAIDYADYGLLVVSAHGEAQGPRVSLPRLGTAGNITDPVVLFPKRLSGGNPLIPEPMEFVWLPAPEPPFDATAYGPQAIWLGTDGRIAFSNKLLAYAPPSATTPGHGAVIFNTCKSMWNYSFSREFNRRLMVYFGYTDYISRETARAGTDSALGCLISQTVSRNIGTTYIKDTAAGMDWCHYLAGTNGFADESRFDETRGRTITARMFGSYTASVRDGYSAAIIGPPALQTGGVSDPKFLSSSVYNTSPSWKPEGDVRFFPSVGDSAEPAQRYTGSSQLALLSTGLGFTQSSGAISQRMCVLPGTRTLSFDYNFITSEPAFWCEDPRFQDTFQVVVTLPGEEPQVVFSTDVDTVCFGEHETSLFTIPEPEDELGSDGITLATGWKRVKLPLDLTPYAATGNPVEIRFEVVDRGDSFWDSAVLLRNIVEDTN